MFEIISAVSAATDIVAVFDLLELVDEETVKLIKVRVIMRDGSILHITELSTSRFQKYSYHLQDRDGLMIVRWDNSPHWPDLSTFPHHRHEAGKVYPSERIQIFQVINFIRARNKGI